jgi:hypothetical protein
MRRLKTLKSLGAANQLFRRFVCYQGFAANFVSSDSRPEEASLHFLGFPWSDKSFQWVTVNPIEQSSHRPKRAREPSLGVIPPLNFRSMPGRGDLEDWFRESLKFIPRISTLDNSMTRISATLQRAFRTPKEVQGFESLEYVRIFSRSVGLGSVAPLTSVG